MERSKEQLIQTIADLESRLAIAREGLEEIITKADCERGNAMELKEIAEQTLKRMKP